MSLRYRWMFFRECTLPRLRRRLKQIFCRHQVTHESMGWTGCATVCKRCRKTLKFKRWDHGRS